MPTWFCCWSCGTLNDPLIDRPDPYSYKDFQRGQNIAYVQKPATVGGYPAKGLIAVSTKLHEDEISMRLHIKPEFVKIFMSIYVESRHHWLDGMYPPYCLYRDEVDDNVYHCIHDIEDALDDLQRCTRLTQRDTDVVCFFTDDEVSQVHERLYQYGVRTVMCERKRYNSFDDNLIQYPIYKVVLFVNATEQILMEIVTHNLNERDKVFNSLQRYDAKCKAENTLPTFQYKALQHVKPKRNIGRIRISGNLTHALHYLTSTPIDTASLGTVRESSLNPDRMQDILDTIQEVEEAQQHNNQQ